MTDTDETTFDPASDARSAASAAMLDRETEDALYTLFRNYFHIAENERRWNLWEDVAWEQVKTPPSDALADAVLSAYRDELFIPDYSTTVLKTLRSSRGRAWFTTRWMYEEGKHLLTLNEWLMRSGAKTDAEMKSLSNDVLGAYRWEPVHGDPPAVMADALAWELHEIETYRALRRAAEQEGDTALAEVLRLLLTDEEAHRDFFQSALNLIAERHPDLVQDAVRRAADAQESEATGKTLLALFDLTPTPPAG